MYYGINMGILSAALDFMSNYIIYKYKNQELILNIINKEKISIFTPKFQTR